MSDAVGSDTHTTDDHDHVAELQENFEMLRNGLRDAWDTIDALESRVKDLEKENNELRSDVTHLDERTNLLNLVEHTDELGPEQRSTILIQNLHKKARKRERRGDIARAEINRNAAENTLQNPDVHRSIIIDDMRRAERLVDDTDLLEYQSEPGVESVLKLDLTGENELAAEYTTDSNGGG